MNDSFEQQLEQVKRFHAEQYKELGIKVIQLETLLKNFSPGVNSPSRPKDALARQVDNLTKKVKFLEDEITRLKSK